MVFHTRHRHINECFSFSFLVIRSSTYFCFCAIFCGVTTTTLDDDFNASVTFIQIGEMYIQSLVASHKNLTCNELLSSDSQFGKLWYMNWKLENRNLHGGRNKHRRMNHSFINIWHSYIQLHKQCTLYRIIFSKILYSLKYNIIMLKNISLFILQYFLRLLMPDIKNL